MNTLLPDVNLKNDQNSADYFVVSALVGQNLLHCYDATQNTPEFVLNHMKYDFVESESNFGLV